MDSGTLAYETTLVARTEGFPSSLERGRTRRRETRNGAQKLKQDETNQLYSLHCAFMHETSSRFWANFRPPSSVPPAIRLELLFRAINARRYASQGDNSEKCFGRMLYDRSDLTVITRFW